MHTQKPAITFSSKAANGYFASDDERSGLSVIWALRFRLFAEALALVLFFCSSVLFSESVLALLSCVSLLFSESVALSSFAGEREREWRLVVLEIVADVDVDASAAEGLATIAEPERLLVRRFGIGWVRVNSIA
jgi:hypothetical protein